MCKSKLFFTTLIRKQVPIIYSYVPTHLIWVWVPNENFTSAYPCTVPFPFSLILIGALEDTRTYYRHIIYIFVHTYTTTSIPTPNLHPADAYIVDWITLIGFNCCSCAQPYCIRNLIKYFSLVDEEKVQQISVGYTYASGIVLLPLVVSCVVHWEAERMLQTGMQVRVALSSVIYQKVIPTFVEAFACLLIL